MSKSLTTENEPDQQNQAPEPTRLKKKPPSIDGWFFHVLIGGLVIVMGILLNINSEGRVGMKLWPHFVIPELCFSQRYFAADCPICGMTRSVISIAHGRWQDSITYHWMGPLVFLVIALQIPYGLQLRFSNRPWIASGKFILLAWSLLIVLLLTTWIYRGVST